MKGNGKTVFKWTSTQQQTFEKLKHKLCTALVLVLLDLHQPFEIETDASDYSLGTVITQSGHPATFHFKTFNDNVRRYSTYEKELCAIVQALKQWRHYSLGKEMFILTDHKPLRFAPTHSKLQTTRQLKWINYLQQFQLVIKYRKGKANATADCLSQLPITLLSIVMSMQGYETTTWPQLYSVDCDFSTIYLQL